MVSYFNESYYLKEKLEQLNKPLSISISGDI